MEYRLIHEKSIVVDAHNDVLSGAVARGHNISKRLDSGNTDLVRLKEGGVDVQVFAIFCDDSFGTGVAFTEAEKQADAFKMLINENSGKIVATRNLDEISHAVESGKIAAMLAIEGGHMLEDDISKLHKIAEWGVCYLTLTWNNSTSWASSAVDEFNATRNGKTVSVRGLSEFGREIVFAMNQLDIVVDLAHAGPRTFFDAVECSSKPVIVSHGNAYAICPVVRNLADDQIRAVANTGGVIGVTFYAPFVDAVYTDKIELLKKKNSGFVAMLEGQGLKGGRLLERLFNKYPQEAELIRPSVSQVVDHIDYMVNIAGIDHVGLGSDYFATTTHPFPKGMADVTGYPLITQELSVRGYPEHAIENILGGNFLRVLTVV